MEKIGRWIAGIMPGNLFSSEERRTDKAGNAPHASQADQSRVRTSINPAGAYDSYTRTGAAGINGNPAETDGEQANQDENRDGWLQYQENGLIVRIYLHEGVTKVGRSKQMDYSVNGPTVSRAHAEFVRRDHHYYVRDTNSTCGTYLNGSPERIDGNQEFELHPKDEVRLGNVKMTFLTRGVPEEQAV